MVLWRPYTGVGARDTPLDVCAEQVRLSAWLWRRNYRLRSGGAWGSDESFERGVGRKADMEIILPQYSFRGRIARPGTPYSVVPDELEAQGREIAASVHPKWSAVEAKERAGDPFAASAHIRNVLQVLGLDLKSPSDFLVCWAPIKGKSVDGGTRTAYELAKRNGIPAWNLASTQDIAEMRLTLTQSTKLGVSVQEYLKSIEAPRLAGNTFAL
jgi:hypothetical protein